MSMTRKNFEAIAASVQDVREQCSDAPETTWAINEIASNLADTCAAENPNFDRERFMAACGVED